VQPYFALQAGDEPQEGEPEPSPPNRAPLVTKTALKPATNKTEPTSTRDRRAVGVRAVRTSTSPAGAEGRSAASCSPDRPVTNDR
jgi:hypothetical protein